jgi:hypothetical protein
MSNKVSISNEQCLTEEQLLRYAEGVMTRDEERAVDRHIATCDMCSDAVEGAMMIPVQDFKKHSASIGGKIDKTFDTVSDKIIVEKRENTEGVKENATHTLKPVRSFRLLRWVTVAAASILVLATAGIWLLTTDAPTSQDAKSASAETDIEATPPSYSMDKKLSDTLTSSSPSGSFSIENNSANVATVPQKAPQIASKPISTNDNTLADVETETKKDNAPTPPASFGSAPKHLEQPIGNQVVKEEKMNDIVVDSDTKREQETAYRQSSEAAKSKMKVDDRVASSNAQSKMTPSAATAPSAKMVSADEQLFQKGVTYFNQQDYGNALSNFSKVKEEKVNSDVYEQVQWLSAMSQLKQGKKVIAKSILETIVAGKGKYAAQATEVLKTSF